MRPLQITSDPCAILWVNSYCTCAYPLLFSVAQYQHRTSIVLFSPPLIFRGYHHSLSFHGLCRATFSLDHSKRKKKLRAWGWCDVEANVNTYIRTYTAVYPIALLPNSQATSLTVLPYMVNGYHIVRHVALPRWHPSCPSYGNILRCTDSFLR